VEGAHIVADFAADSPVTAIVGCEVSTADGHLLAIGVEEAPEPNEPLAATARQVRDRGGVAVVPHPFQRSRHGAGARAIDDVDGIEVYNAHTLVNVRNEQATRYARQHDYPAFGGSDAHRPGSIGLAATEVKLHAGESCTEAAVLDALREGRTAAVGRRTSAWQYVTKLVATARYNAPSPL